MNENFRPGINFPEANALAGRVAVTVCAVLSLFTHVTFVPGVTVMWDGLKAKLWMVTVAVLLCAPAVGAKASAKASRATNESAANRSSVFLIRVLLLVCCDRLLSVSFLGGETVRTVIRCTKRIGLRTFSRSTLNPPPLFTQVPRTDVLRSPHRVLRGGIML